MYPYCEKYLQKEDEGGGGGVEWNELSSVSGDLDTLEEEESEYSLTIHSAIHRKLRLLSTNSDDSGMGIEDPDSGEKSTDHDLEDETDSYEETLTERHILNSQELEDSLQEAAVCLDPKPFRQSQAPARQ